MSSSSTSSAFRRLHGLFTAKPSVPKSAPATSLPKPAAAEPPPPPPPPPAEDEALIILVKRFKRACRSSRFRRCNSPTYESTVRRLAVANRHSLIEDIINHQKKYDNITSEGFVVRLLRLYAKSGMFEQAQELFDEMPELKCDRTVRSFNALLSACVTARKFDKISELFNELPEKLSIKPDIISYNTVVKAFCEMDSFDSVFSMVEEMEKNGVEPDLITFNTLLHTYYTSNRFSDAEKVWRMMEDKNLVPDARCYNPKLRALVRNERVDEAVELIEEMKGKGVEPDTPSFNSLIKGFCENGCMEEAKRWYGEMKRNGCKPDRITYVELGYLACKKGDFDYAFDLCKEAIDRRLFIYKSMVQLVVDGLVKDSKMKEAEELVKLGNSNDYYKFKLELPSNE